jgi:hypothetical protein
MLAVYFWIVLFVLLLMFVPDPLQARREIAMRESVAREAKRVG